MFDLSPLSKRCQEVEFEYVAGIDGRMTAESLEDFDALVLLLEKFDANSIPKSNRLALIARFGVGFDTVDVEACKNMLVLRLALHPMELGDPSRFQF